MLSHAQCLEKLKELRGLQDEKKKLDQEKKEIQEQIDELQKDLTEYFDMNEMQNITLEGTGLFYMQRTAYPQIEDPVAVKEWLAERGDLDLIMSFNSNKFRTYWKEKIEQGEEVPPHVNQFIKQEIRMRRG